ncbi:MAG: hypothetical protein HY395_03045 [Candidatus Doudnabacteria bacterium]|nr:hypothetical protein [Candidatus Doudnabacteria bacterium]
MRKYQLSTILALALVVVVLGWYFLSQPKSPGPKTEEPVSVSDQVKKLDIETFSLSGTVKSVEAKALIFETGMVLDEEIVNLDFKANVSASTKISKQVQGQSIKLSEIKSGDIIVVYTKTNPYENLIVEADKIELVK